MGDTSGMGLGGVMLSHSHFLTSSDCSCHLASTHWQTGLAISYAVWAASRSFTAFLASRVIGGISKGNVSLSTAIVADLGSPPTRSQGMVSEKSQGKRIDVWTWVSVPSSGHLFPRQSSE